VKEMMQKPEKRNSDGMVVEGATAFSQKEVDTKRFIGGKDDVRKNFYTVVDGVIVKLSESRLGRAAFEANDRADQLVDTFQYNNLSDMENAGLREAVLDESPWSDDYWALYKGILGCRYADPLFPSSEDWMENFTYVQDNPALGIVAKGKAAEIDLLSPSEKYDLLVGDNNGSLTRKMWEEGEYYYNRSGSVETWMGICHGWAPAAYMLSRPQKTVTVIAADGATPIRFFPSDIKSLASLLWANARTVTRFVGGRCNDTDPEFDPDNGRALSAKCFDTNPGTWHLAMVNQIGGARRSFVLDVTYDYEVWNQPAHGYEYWYFNPKEMQWADTEQEGTVAMADFDNDRFSAYRSGKTASVVGIMMRVQYIVETDPSHQDIDAPSDDKIQTVDYYYDVELDRDGLIIGGELYQNLHPDFLWTPPVGTRAISTGDSWASGEWSAGNVFPSGWQGAARHASSRSSLPLAKVVESLIRFSRT
jgi:hypothetical protein